MDKHGTWHRTWYEGEQQHARQGHTKACHAPRCSCHSAVFRYQAYHPSPSLKLVATSWTLAKAPFLRRMSEFWSRSPSSSCGKYTSKYFLERSLPSALAMKAPDTSWQAENRTSTSARRMRNLVAYPQNVACVIVCMLLSLRHHILLLLLLLLLLFLNSRMLVETPHKHGKTWRNCTSTAL